MKRRRPRLSFDEDEDSVSGSSAPEQGGDGERQAAAKQRRGGLPQRSLQPSSLQAAGPGAAAEGHAEDLAQIAALRAALGLAPRKAELADRPSPGPDDPESGGEGAAERGPGEAPASPPAWLPASLADIQTFSEFLRLTSAIRAAAGELPAEELTALCETASRLKFFDRELFDDVLVHIRAKIRSKQFSVEQVSAVGSCLAELNAYDTEVFRAAAAMLLPLVPQLSKAQRLLWLKMMASVGHHGDDAFEIALRTLPLPGGMDVSAHDDFMLCWDFVKLGACPRGARCRWTHPREVKVTK